MTNVIQKWVVILAGKVTSVTSDTILLYRKNPLEKPVDEDRRPSVGQGDRGAEIHLDELGLRGPGHGRAVGGAGHRKCRFRDLIPAHEYEVIIAEGITWTAAQAAVGVLGAGWYLATITDAAEQTFANSLLPTGLVDRSHFWLGGSDAAVEGTWTWVTSEIFGYTNWWGGEPNNQGNEDYLTLDFRLPPSVRRAATRSGTTLQTATPAMCAATSSKGSPPSRCPPPRGCCCRALPDLDSWPGDEPRPEERLRI